MDTRGPDWTSIMQAADEPTADGRKMPGGGCDVDLPGNRGQGLERNLNGFDPAGDCLVRLARLLGSLRRTRQSPAPDQKPTPLPA